MAKKTPDPKKPGHAKPALSEDDAALFDRAMRHVDRIKRRKSDAVKPSLRTTPEPAQPKEAAVASRPVKPHATPRPKSSPALPPLAAGASADVDSRTMDRLRRGRLRPEGRLDLHGMTQDKAHRALNRYVLRAQSSGLRCIIVITGKGRVSEGGGVLRNQVPRWLNAPDIRPCILAFAPAQARDGGAGALYVLLRRRR